MRIDRLVAIAALSTFTACDFLHDPTFDTERADADYRTAMDDYQAGRLGPALKGFTKVCAANPSNASARFQLACLLQDGEKDYLGAFCAYREYLLQQPKSEKAKLAKDRLAVCEREVAKLLASKYDLNAIEKEAQVAEGLRKALEESKGQVAKQQKSLADSTRRIAALEAETARLKNLLRVEGEAPLVDPANLSGAKAVVAAEDDAPVAADALAEAKRLLAEDETNDAPVNVDEAKALLADDPEPPPMIAQKKLEDENQNLTRVSDILSELEKQVGPLEKQAAAAAKREADEKAREQKSVKYEKHPADGYYVVQEGDTLYKLAIRFYGRRDAWKTIREANKAIVSTDGRIRTGQRLKLPPVKE